MSDPFSSDERAVQDFLSGGGIAAKFPKVGHEHKGTVLRVAMRQQTKYGTGDPLFWADGSKRMEAVITLQGEPTGETWEGLTYDRVELPDDDGQRILYAKGNLAKAIGRALKDQGNAVMEVNGYLKVVRIKDGAKTKSDYRPPFDFKAEWTPAAKNGHAATAVLTGGDNPFSD